MRWYTHHENTQINNMNTFWQVIMWQFRKNKMIPKSKKETDIIDTLQINWSVYSIIVKASKLICHSKIPCRHFLDLHEMSKRLTVMFFMKSGFFFHSLHHSCANVCREKKILYMDYLLSVQLCIHIRLIESNLDFSSVTSFQIMHKKEIIQIICLKIDSV